MNILELIEETGYAPKKKAATHGGEYCSPCPFCKEGDDRFLIWPLRHNNNGEYQGGRFSCRVCGKYGDAISFLRELGLTYPEACARLHVEPKGRNVSPLPRPKPKPQIADEPPGIWQEKAKAFVEWAHAQLLSSNEGLTLLRKRGFADESISRFRLGYNPQNLFRERTAWGLPHEIKPEDGKARRLWLPGGVVIPTFSAGQVIKVKIRRSDWKEGDRWPKYAEVSGSKQIPSIYGDTSLPALILESELDALLLLQEAGDLVYCVALGGSTKPLDRDTDALLRAAPALLFCPDYDKAGKIAWDKWKKMFPNIQRVLTPQEKSAGDYFLAGGDLCEWIEDSIKEIRRKRNIEAKKK